MKSGDEIKSMLSDSLSQSTQQKGKVSSELALQSYFANRKDKLVDFITEDELLSSSEKAHLIHELISDISFKKNEEVLSEIQSHTDSSLDDHDISCEPTPPKRSTLDSRDNSPRVTSITSLPNLSVHGRARAQSHSPRSLMTLFSPRRISPRPDSSPPQTPRINSAVSEEKELKTKHKSSPRMFGRLLLRKNSGKKADLSSGDNQQDKNSPRMRIDADTAGRYLKEARLPQNFGKSLKFYSSEMLHEIIVPINGAHDGYILDRNTCFGQGGLGKVVAAFDLKKGELVSAKIFHKKPQQLAFDKEISNLKRIDRYYSSFDSAEPIIFMKYFPGISLVEFFYELNLSVSREDPSFCKNKKNIPPFQKLKIIRLILEQLSILHEAGLMHRDIKPDNLLIHITPEGDIEITLIDLADAVSTNEISSVHRGSDGYIPPELIGTRDERKPYTKESDFYQIGLVIAEIISKKNYQRKISKKLIEFSNEDTKQDIHLEMIAEMLNDVFGKKPMSEFEYSDDDVEKHVNDILYNHIIFQALNNLVLALVTSRLKGSSLQDEIKKLKELEQSCLNLSRMITAQFLDASQTQATLISTVELLFAKNSTIIREQFIQPLIYNGVLTDLTQLFKSLLTISSEEEKAPLFST